MCYHSLLECCYGCRTIRPILSEVAAVAFLYGTGKTVPSSEAVKRVCRQVSCGDITSTTYTAVCIVLLSLLFVILLFDSEKAQLLHSQCLLRSRLVAFTVSC